MSVYETGKRLITRVTTGITADESPDEDFSGALEAMLTTASRVQRDRMYVGLDSIER